MAILLVGGAGNIGSHVAVELLNNGKEIIIMNNFSDRINETLAAIKKITKKYFKFYRGNCLNVKDLEIIFQENKIDAVMDFASYKFVGESIKKPIEYYTNNVCGPLILLSVMRKYDVRKFIFSSSSLIYGETNNEPITEDTEPKGELTPYARTKLYTEQILSDLYRSDNSWDICILRYFNSVGFHESGLLGNSSSGNLITYMSDVAMGKSKELLVNGNDYNTVDGTCVRDYIHVVDLAKGHIKALEKLDKEKNGIFTYNLCSGKPTSILELKDEFEKVSGRKIPFRILPRREGDMEASYGSTEKAKSELGFTTEKTIRDICKDTWNYMNKEIDRQERE